MNRDAEGERRTNNFTGTGNLKLVLALYEAPPSMHSGIKKWFHTHSFSNPLDLLSFKNLLGDELAIFSVNVDSRSSFFISIIGILIRVSKTTLSPSNLLSFTNVLSFPSPFLNGFFKLGIDEARLLTGGGSDEIGSDILRLLI